MEHHIVFCAFDLLRFLEGEVTQLIIHGNLKEAFDQLLRLVG